MSNDNERKHTFGITIQHLIYDIEIRKYEKFSIANHPYSVMQIQLSLEQFTNVFKPFGKSQIEIQLFKRATPLKFHQGYWPVKKLCYKVFKYSITERRSASDNLSPK